MSTSWAVHLRSLVLAEELLRDGLGNKGNHNAVDDEVETDEAEARYQPLNHKMNRIVTTWRAHADNECTEQKQKDVDCGHAGVVSVPLVLDLFRSLGVQVQLLWRYD